MFLLTYFFYILTYFSTYYKLIDQNTNFLYIVLGFNGGNYQLVGLFYCDKYSRETTIQGRKLLISRTFLVRQLFKGDNYSREETIRGNTVVLQLLMSRRR